MNTLSISKSHIANNIILLEDKFTVIINDGREITVPFEWFPKLKNATKTQLASWRFIGNGEGIHWSELDEDISVDALFE